MLDIFRFSQLQEPFSTEQTKKTFTLYEVINTESTAFVYLIKYVYIDVNGQTSEWSAPS